MKKMPKPIAFEWNKGNLDKNWNKHKVEIKEAEEVFINKFKMFEDVGHSQIEKRFSILGETNKKRRLYCSFTVRDGKIRVISVRDQSRKERRLYEEKNN